MILLISIFLLLAFLLRSFLLIKNGWVGNDTFAYATYALEFKKKKHMIKIPDKMKPPYNDFVPQLFTALLSFFPKKFYRYIQFLSPVMDLITMILLYYFSLTFFGETVALISSLVYAITPIAVYSCFSLGPRSFSNTSFTLSMLSLFFYFLSSNLIFLIPFFIFTAIVLLSHRLTTQSIVVVTLVESIIFFNFVPILVLIAVVIFWLITLRGTYAKILKTHYEKLSNYAKKGSYREGRLKLESPTRMFSSFPFILLLIIYLIFSSFSQTFLEVWFLSILVLSFVWVLGDGFRHLANAVFPGSILVGIAIMNLPFSEIVFLIFTLISFVGTLKLIQTYQNSHNTIKKGFIECCKFIKKNAKRSDVLVSFPIDYHYAYVAIFFADINVIGGPIDYSERSVSTTGKVGEYKITWVVTNKPSLFRKSKIFKQKFENNGFFVFKKR